MRISDNPGLFHGLLYIIRHREFFGILEGIPLHDYENVGGVVNVLENLCTFRSTGFPRAFVSVKEWFPLCEIPDLVMNHHVRHDFSIYYRVTIITWIFHCREYNFFEPDFLPSVTFPAGVPPKRSISFSSPVFIGSAIEFDLQFFKKQQRTPVVTLKDAGCQHARGSGTAGQPLRTLPFGISG